METTGPKITTNFRPTRAQVADGRATTRTDAVYRDNCTRGVSDGFMAGTLRAFVAELEKENQTLRSLLKEATTRTERIVCPVCGSAQEAKKYWGGLFDVMVHTCTACGYDIGESEWEPAEPLPVPVTPDDVPFTVKLIKGGE